MRPSEAFSQHRETIRRLVAEHGMTNPRLFGSALHGDDVEGSDLDILVDAPDHISLLDLARLENALSDAIGTKVDLRLPEELHPSFRARVLDEAIAA